MSSPRAPRPNSRSKPASTRARVSSPKTKSESAQGRTDARRAALHAIVSAMDSDTPLFSLLDKQEIIPAARAFARELCGGVMRQRARIDWTLQPLLKSPLKKLDAPVREALRLAAYERIVLQTPPHVVADEYAGLMRGEKLTSAVSFVNAIARRLSESWRPLPERKKNPALFLAIEYSHPVWIVERWLARYGFEECEKLLQANNEIAPLCLRVNTFKTSRDRVLESLQGRGLKVHGGCLSPDSIWVLDAHGSPDSWPQWTDGEIIAQDEAAQIVARVVSPQDSWTIVDAASAPGGKTTHIAQLMNNSGRIIACDRSASRLRLVTHNAQRLGINSIETFAGDFREFNNESSTRPLKVDAVLLDAPCLGTGTWRRRPDARWRKTPAQLAELVQLQRELLDAAAQLLEVGGVLVYSTCSLEPEENELQIAAFLARHDEFAVDAKVPFHAREIAHSAHDSNGFWRTSPAREYSNENGTSRPDGMFAARLVRVS